MRVACLLLVVAAACKGTERPVAIPLTAKIPLRYHPAPGAVFHYWLEQSSRFAPDTAAAADSATATTMTLAFTQQIGARSGDGYPLTVTLDSSTVASPMLDPQAAAAAAGRLRGITLTGVLDDRLRFVRTDLSGLAGLPPIVREQVQLGIRAAALPFPDQPVGPGDRWTNQTELPFAQLAGGTPFTVESRITVRGITVTGADTTVQLGVETGLPDRPLQFNFGGQLVTVTLRGGITGEQVFSLTRGAVVSGALGGTVHLNVTGGFFGTQGMAMRVEQRAATRLVEPPGR
jgi:hypothetical protein